MFALNVSFFGPLYSVLLNSPRGNHPLGLPIVLTQTRPSLTSPRDLPNTRPPTGVVWTQRSSSPTRPIVLPTSLYGLRRLLSRTTPDRLRSHPGLVANSKTRAPLSYMWVSRLPFFLIPLSSRLRWMVQNSGQWIFRKPFVPSSFFPDKIPFLLLELHL